MRPKWFRHYGRKAASMLIYDLNESIHFLIVLQSKFILELFLFALH